MKFCIIFACDKDGGIGNNNALPWSLKEDLRHFKNVTLQKNQDEINVLVMGRKTFDSIGNKTFDNERHFIVITNNNTNELIPNVTFFDKIDPLEINNVIKNHENFKNKKVNTVFYCGGKSIYDHLKEYLYFIDTIYVTHIEKSYQTDKKINLQDFIKNKNKVEIINLMTSQDVELKFCNYYNTNNHEEYSYMELCKNILLNGELRKDRTNVGTYSLFGQKLEFSLKDNIIPALTTKKLAYKSVIKELLWFISGSTNSKLLEASNVKIWSGNTSREFLDNRGLTDLEEGDIGAGYGFQWRHFGADYKGMYENYENQGVDQLKEVIRLIKEDPFSRRIILTAWNPNALNRMALPPCHMMAQFYVSISGELSCQMYQRSCDMFLGVPFNIMSYSLLTHMIAHVTGLKANKLVMCFGDTHIYSNHTKQVITQLNNSPFNFPTISFNNSVRSIFDFTIDDITLENYKSHPFIKAPMAV